MNYQALIPQRAYDVHKGQCGRIGVLAGSIRMPGAGILAALAALRSGAGVVYLIIDQTLAPLIAIQYPELIVLGYEDWGAYEFDVMIVGPGLGALVHDFRDRVLALSIPLVLDADALVPEFVSYLSPGQAILTPHPGEFLRLWGEVGADRSLAAQRAARASGQVLVLKGAGTVISDGKKTQLNGTGNPGMATAGSGDVLAGLIGGILGQYASPRSLYDAACLGTYWHGIAGDLAFKQFGNGLIASDIIRNVGRRSD